MTKQRVYYIYTKENKTHAKVIGVGEGFKYSYPLLPPKESVGVGFNYGPTSAAGASNLAFAILQDFVHCPAEAMLLRERFKEDFLVKTNRMKPLIIKGADLAQWVERERLAAAASAAAPIV